jgi:hypothetical protein
MIEWGRKRDVAYVPAWRTQLVAARSVAEELAARRGDDLRVEEASDSNDPNRVPYESGAQLPGKEAILAGPTFEAWLDAL